MTQPHAPIGAPPASVRAPPRPGTLIVQALGLRAARLLAIDSDRALIDIARAVGHCLSTRRLRHDREAFGRSPRKDRARVNQFPTRGFAALRPGTGPGPGSAGREAARPCNRGGNG